MKKTIPVIKKLFFLIKEKQAPELIKWCFCISLSYILVYELILKLWPSYCDIIYKLGIISSVIFYSVIASCIFYFISQYIPDYLPKEKRKIKVLYGVYKKILIINTRIENLKFELDIIDNDFYFDFEKKLQLINPNKAVAQFDNWYQYLYHLKTQLVDIIRSVTVYNDYLSLGLMEELTLIEEQLLSLHAFEGHKAIISNDLVYATIQLQEILIHNKHLRELKETEAIEYKEKFQKEGEAYREKYYPASLMNTNKHNDKGANNNIIY